MDHRRRDSQQVADKAEQPGSRAAAVLVEKKDQAASATERAMQPSQARKAKIAR